MKLSAALTLTTVASIMSATHAMPLHSAKTAPNTAPAHFRRASSVSELQGRQFHGDDMLDGLNVAFEPGNGIKNLLNFVKRQLGSTDSTSATGASAGSGSSQSTESTQSSDSTDSASSASAGLMGGDITSAESAGFAFEPGQGLTAK